MLITWNQRLGSVEAPWKGLTVKPVLLKAVAFYKHVLMALSAVM